MSFKRMPDGRIEVSDGYRICIMVPSKHIVAIVRDVDQTAHSGKDVCRVVFSPDAKLKGLLPSREPYDPDDKSPPVYMYMYKDIDMARIDLRKAMGMTDEQISEDMGMEILAEVP